MVNNLPLQYETPEPQYTETKSSILRRRNSIAKLNSRLVLLLCIKTDNIPSIKTSSGKTCWRITCFSFQNALGNCIISFHSGKLSESLDHGGRRRRSKRRFSSLTNLADLTSNTGKKASGQGRRRRNSISLDDIQNLKRFPLENLD